MKKMTIGVFALLFGLSLMPMAAHAQAVLGACTDEAVEARKQGTALPPEQAMTPAAACEAGRVPLPGEPAIDFQLTAVVGNEIKKIKLSDYQGKYRVLCFYPADFTFV